jgi:transcription termination factor NusB
MPIYGVPVGGGPGKPKHRPRLGRAIALQILYTMLATSKGKLIRSNIDVDSAFESYTEDLTVDDADDGEPETPANPAVVRSAKIFARHLVDGVLTNLADIDQKIDATKQSTFTYSMPLVDLLVARIAIFEMLYDKIDVPLCIKEAMVLSDRYCGIQATRGIVGLLNDIKLAYL